VSRELVVADIHRRTELRSVGDSVEHADAAPHADGFAHGRFWDIYDHGDSDSATS